MSIFTDDTVKQLFFYKGDTEITGYVIPGSYKVQDYICTGQLNFGETNTAKVQFKTSEDLSLTGNYITVRYGTNENNVQIGKYKINYSSHKTNSTVVTVTGYDAVKQFNKDISEWYNALTWPIRVSDFRKSLCEYIGVGQERATLVNDDFQIEETIAPSKLSGIEMLFYIGQINGVFPHATTNYTLDWVSLGTDIYEIPKNITYGPQAYESKSYTTASIGGVVIRQEDGDVGVSFGTTNKYVVQGNILVYGCSADELSVVANRLYEKIKDIRYIPCSIKTKYMPDISLGTRCAYDGNVFYVLQRETSGILFNTLTAGGNEYLESDDSIESEIEQLRGKSNVLKREIEVTKSTISDVEKGLKNEIEQTSERLGVELDALQSQVDGDVKQYNVNYEPTLLNYPAWDFTYNIPCNNTVQLRDDLKFIYKDSYYSKNARSVVFDYSTSMSYRFVKEDDNWYWKPIGDTEFGVAMSKIAKLEVTAENINTQISSLDKKITNDYITTADCTTKIKQTSQSIKQEANATYATKAMLGDYSTTVKMNAAIELAASGIKQEVSADYATKTSLSQAEQKADKITWLIKSGTSAANMALTSEMYKLLADNITLSGKHITLDGDTVVSAGFTLSCDKLKGGEINGQRIIGCTMSGCAASFGENNIILNEDGFWVIGSGNAGNPALKIDNAGSLHFYDTAALDAAGAYVYSGGKINFGLWSGIIKAAQSASDESVKDNIKTLDDAWEEFYDELTPIEFNFKEDFKGYDSSVKHLGFGAHAIKTNAQIHKKENLAMVWDSGEYLSLDKQELIALNTWQIQKLKKQVSMLTDTMAELIMNKEVADA